MSFLYNSINTVFCQNIKLIIVTLRKCLRYFFTFAFNKIILYHITMEELENKKIIALMSGTSCDSILLKE